MCKMKVTDWRCLIGHVYHCIVTRVNCLVVRGDSQNTVIVCLLRGLVTTTVTGQLSVQPLGRCSVTAALFARSANDIY